MRILGLEIGHFLVAVTFLTRLPMPGGLDHFEGRLARAARYFPLVGVLIGAIAGVTYFVAHQFVTPLLAAALALTASLLVTGALHEDGLADTCDGLGGAPDSDRALEIMRDSHIGTYGAAALVMSLGLRSVALSSFGATDGLIALVVAHALSRAMLPAVLTSTNYVRSQGLALSVAGGVRGAEAMIALLLALVVAMTAGLAAGLIAVAAGIVGAGITLVWVLRRLGGYTGDTLGAIQQVSEISVLIALSAYLS